ncbi:MAG: aldo/keto reductase [Candidatus Saccharicenans sp.]|jgi:predicted aldo/keto reductase-like oxidoreductase|nr:aldo/keto reductase [Candidatus Saccharicenans sp.]MDH7492815.1 aldo/keto reductase [Candidatus Saccharicenans sp.]
MKKSALNRRDFLKVGLTGLVTTGAAGLLLADDKQKKQDSKKQSGPASGPQPPGGRREGFIYRTLGRTGVVLPVVSMGVMNSDNPELVRAALDSGLVHLDTAHGYQRGRNEEIIGQVIKGRPRDSFFLATKVREGDRFLEMVDISLQRLGLDYVDILYLHNLSQRDNVLAEENLKVMEQVKKSGKARFIGLSTHANEPEVIRAAIEARIFDVVLTGYNFRKNYIKDLDAAIAEATATGVGIIAMKTMAGAFWDKQRTQPINTKAALKWALNNPNITTAIPGMTTFDQLKSNLEVVKDLKLTPEELYDLKIGETAGLAGLYCQGCQRCLPQCPKGLPIPEMMRAYMYAYGYKNLAAAHELVSSLNLPDNPCAGCSSCSVNCAFRFDVRERLVDINRLKSVPTEFFA